VAADVAWAVAEVVESNLASCLFEGGVDVLGGDCAPVGVERVVKTEEVCVGSAVVAEDVVYPAGKGVNGTICGAGAFLVDALTFDFIFLVGHLDGCFGNRQESSQR
jgi:hypothetical protein